MLPPTPAPMWQSLTLSTMVMTFCYAKSARILSSRHLCYRKCSASSVMQTGGFSCCGGFERGARDVAVGAEGPRGDEGRVVSLTRQVVTL